MADSDDPPSSTNDTLPTLSVASGDGDAALVPGTLDTVTTIDDRSAEYDREQLDRLEHYDLLGELGRGAMGVVYAAHDNRLERKVAIKTLHTVGDPGRARRLVREAKALAKLSHPNVIPVHEFGETGDTTFIVMEYVEGLTLRGWLAAEPRTLEQIVEVFAAAGRGLAAAHQKGMVHRDFKPDNVMVGDDGRVRVTDFGLARAERGHASDTGDGSSQLGSSVELTHTGAVMGTPAYMAPEQLRGDPAGAASDQFGFCVALYEAVHGRRPFEGASLTELAHAVERGPSPEPPADTRAPAWLHELIVRGLAPAIEDRFASMDALLDALAARGEVRAPAPSELDEAPAIANAPASDEGPAAIDAGRPRAWRRWLIGAGVTALGLGLVAFAVVEAMAWRRAQREDEAWARQRELQVEARNHRATLSPERARRAVELIAGDHEAEALRLALLAIEPYDRGMIGPAPPEILEAVRRVLAEDAAPIGYRELLAGHEGAIRAVAWSPDGARIATASEDGTARIWELSGRPGRLVLDAAEGAVGSLAWSRDGDELVTAGADGDLRIWEISRGTLVRRLDGHDAHVERVAAVDGDRLTSVDLDGRVIVWEWSTGTRLASFEIGDVDAVAWSRDGDALASASVGEGVSIRDPGTGLTRVTLAADDARVAALAWSPDGRALASASDDGRVWIWEVASGQVTATWAGDHGRVAALAWSPDGDELASAGEDHRVRSWDPDTGMSLAVFEGHEQPVLTVAWSADGGSVATGDRGGVVGVWRAPDERVGVDPSMSADELFDIGCRRADHGSFPKPVLAACSVAGVDYE